MSAEEVHQEVQVVLDDVDDWLSSTDGQRAVGQALGSVNLPPTFDAYLVEKVSLEAQQFLDGGKAIRSAPAWCTVRLRSRALDLVRSPRGRKRNVTSDDELTVLAGDEGPDHASTIAAELGVVALRKALLRAAEAPWVVSAALTVVAVTFDEAQPGSGCPTPDGGASAAEAQRWVGLWYAGRHRCFDHGRNPEDAVRQHRSRDGRKVKDLLQRVAEMEGLGSHG